MAEGHGWGGASRADSNHPALACASAAPPYPKEGSSSRTYVAVYKHIHWYIDSSGPFLFSLTIRKRVSVIPSGALPHVPMRTGDSLFCQMD
jgi:hypothetical protein